MPEQSYATHRQMVPGFHYVLVGIVFLALVGAGAEVWRAVARGNGRLHAVVTLLLVVAVFLLAWYARVFALRAQDRVIRAEESLRHQQLTGRPLDPRLTVRQIIGLRFASDAEFPELARRAAEERLSEDAIKRAVRTWRPDTYRV